MNSKLFDIFAKLLAIHIATKTTDHGFHKASREAVELALDSDKSIRIMRQDIQEDESKMMDEVAVEAYDLTEELKSELGTMIKENKDPGMDSLLRSLYARANCACGTLRGYAAKAGEEEYEEEEETEMESERGNPTPGLKPKY